MADISNTFHRRLQDVLMLARHLGEAPRIARVCSRFGRPQAAIYHPGGLGDDLMCTTILHELRRRGRQNVWMMTANRALLENNPSVDYICPPDTHLIQKFGFWGLPTLTVPLYSRYIAEEDRDVPPDIPLLARMCQLAGIEGDVDLRPYLYLKPEEIAKGKLAEKQVVIHSCGTISSLGRDSKPLVGTRFPMRTKEWYPERFQQVVDALSPEYTFIQLGGIDNPPLTGVIDLRGKTDVRTSAAILKNSAALIGQVGFLMHLARAVDCRAVIVYGGREAPSQSGYICNENIAETPACSPCWRWTTCINTHDMECMDLISPDRVIDAFRQLVLKLGQPLATEVYCVPRIGE